MPAYEVRCDPRFCASVRKPVARVDFGFYGLRRFAVLHHTDYLEKPDK
jgi:hypothetical protein